ncbi:hypothetical protein LRS71_00255 [Rhodococcus pyridinivorans]|uniref:hypothetical protein n=1 Tax=Rhodococcus pyridinivorans TaxID=103816 RepID=UPI001E59BAE7|nr:hypothetical protein [Rhodococcus pyridinivorans]MCD5418018.1 hypothetical protein [Rhodococcus pyridinivorans]
MDHRHERGHLGPWIFFVDTGVLSIAALLLTKQEDVERATAATWEAEGNPSVLPPDTAVA